MRELKTGNTNATKPRVRNIIIVQCFISFNISDPGLFSTKKYEVKDRGLIAGWFTYFVIYQHQHKLPYHASCKVWLVFDGKATGGLS